MALTRVQGSPKVSLGSSTTINLTFSSQPVVGNAVVVGVEGYSGDWSAISAVDNQGNSYSLAVRAANSVANCAILYCSKITTTGTPFTVTVTKSAGAAFVGSMTEIGGAVGAGLLLDKTVANNFGNSLTTAGTGSTAVLTRDDELVAAVCSFNATQVSITVESVSPTWTQEFEHLSWSDTMPGEYDTRILTGQSGSTQSCNWTITATTTWSAALATFYTVGGGGSSAARGKPGVGVPTVLLSGVVYSTPPHLVNIEWNASGAAILEGSMDEVAWVTLGSLGSAGNLLTTDVIHPYIRPSANITVILRKRKGSF